MRNEKVTAPDMDAPRKGWRKRLKRPLLMGALPLVLLGGGGYAYLNSGRYVSTDNAYAQQDKVSISPDVTGRIVEVKVAENQAVKAGDILFRIDPDPYRIALAQAEAAVASARLQVGQLQTTYQGKGVDIRGAEEEIAFAEEDYQRQVELLKRGFTTRARYQQAQHALQNAREELAAAQAEAAEARAALAGNARMSVDQHPLVRQAVAQRDKAALDLARTVVRAPTDGIVSQTERLQVGQMTPAGLPALSLVANEHVWIEANYKETDLEHMRVGQPATVEFDAYPGHEIHGRVASIGAGTGSEFSVLPAQNATGNWVKVVQRVPVRIELSETPPRALLAGLSAEVTVDTKGQVDPLPVRRSTGGSATEQPIALAATR